MTAQPITRGPAPGELSMVPDVPRQFKEILVKIEQLPDGMLRFTLPAAGNRQWATKRRMDLARIIAEMFTERQIAAVSQWKGTLYDAHPATPQHRRSKPRSRGKKRSDCYDVEEWMEDINGDWISPGGFRFKADAQVVKRVRQERKRKGLPEFPSLADGRRRREATPGMQLGLDIDALLAPHRQAS